MLVADSRHSKKHDLAVRTSRMFLHVWHKLGLICSLRAASDPSFATTIRLILSADGAFEAEELQTLPPRLGKPGRKLRGTAQSTRQAKFLATWSCLVAGEWLIFWP